MEAFITSSESNSYIYIDNTPPSAIDHRTWKTGLPVRSVILKPCAGRLVVGWVTTSEYLLLIVFARFLHSILKVSSLVDSYVSLRFMCAVSLAHGSKKRQDLSLASFV
jgi:hypothetical protein